VILGRGGAGKSTLARHLGRMTGLPVTELDTVFWQPGFAPSEPGAWAARQQELLQRDAWVLDGDLGPYDGALDARLRAADTIVVLDFAFWRCAWRTIRRGREGAIYWRWVWGYRRRSLPAVMHAIAAHAPNAKVYVLRGPGMTRRFLTEVHRARSPSHGSPVALVTLGLVSHHRHRRGGWVAPPLPQPGQAGPDHDEHGQQGPGFEDQADDDAADRGDGAVDQP
jgi:adenylate kinase family enzyme